MIADYKWILVPIDGSSGSCRAAAFAANLARATDSPIVLMHVYSPSPSEVMGMAHLPKKKVEAISQGASEAVFAKVLKGLDLEGLKVEQKSVWGEPRVEIIAEAQAREALIVMGRRGMGKIKKLIIGSVSDAVLRTARVPVTLVN